jgi:tRNA modification GTPase
VLWLVDAAEEKIRSEGTALIWTVRNKIDLDATTGILPQEQANADFEISASRGDGFGKLMAALIAFAQDYFGSGQDALIARERQRQLLQQTAVSLQRSIAAIRDGEELAAEDLRMAAYSLGRLLGRVDVEDILDVIFREFCVGK